MVTSREILRHGWFRLFSKTQIHSDLATLHKAIARQKKRGAPFRRLKTGLYVIAFDEFVDYYIDKEASTDPYPITPDRLTRLKTVRDLFFESDLRSRFSTEAKDVKSFVNYCLHLTKKRKYWPPYYMTVGRFKLTHVDGIKSFFPSTEEELGVTA